LLQYVAQAILHSLVTVAVVEALARIWRVTDPAERLRFRLLALFLPALALPLFMWLAPFRQETWFADRWAVFMVARWADLRPAGIRLDVVATLSAAGAGMVLFLSDLIPFAGARLSPGEAGHRLDAHAGVAETVSRLAGRVGCAAPPVVALETAEPVLMLAGVMRPRIVVSQGTLALLDRSELDAALTHELAHLARRDTQLGWLLMAARAALFFNPAAQVVARAVAHDSERRADDVTARVTGEPLALSSAMLKLYRASRQLPGGFPAGMIARARETAVAGRCRRLIRGQGGQPTQHGRLRLSMTGAGLMVLLFFVV
jgi:Zn-dependent protease with chaperone function